VARNGCRGVLVDGLGEDVVPHAGHVEEAHARFLATHAEQAALDFSVDEKVVGRAAPDSELAGHVAYTSELRLDVGEVARLDRGGGHLSNLFKNCHTRPRFPRMDG
jgi:hypothetical protein